MMDIDHNQSAIHFGQTHPKLQILAKKPIALLVLEYLVTVLATLMVIQI